MDPGSSEPTPNPSSEPDEVDILLSRIETHGLTPSQALSPRSGSAPSPGLWQPPTPEELEKQVPPQYKVLDLVGRGGMGAVYRGWQSSLERYVAIKILPMGAALEESRFRDRFKQEARTMAKFQHPAIVSIYDAGETTTGLLYIVMEFIEGTDVALMVRSQGRLPPEYALAISAHVCDALQYAHTHGVVHRDIKPANVMLNQEGAVKVADFGLARGTDHSQRGLTKSDMTVGTPDYVAPESLIMGIKTDHRVDLYAVGVMIYEMLTGNVPRGMFQMPSDLVGTDERFDSIIARAMDPDREKRYQTAQEMRHDLDVILNTPKLEENGPSSSAIPKQELAVMPQRQMIAQKPVARRPGMTKPVHEVISVTYAPEPAPEKKKKSSLPALIGVAVLAIGGYFGWQQYAAHSPPSASASPAPAASATVQPPPADSIPFNGHRYKLIPSEGASWNEARDQASAMGGHLATLTSRKKSEWVSQTFVAHIPLGKLFHIGGFKPPGKSSPWAWITGEPWSFENWDSNGRPSAEAARGATFMNTELEGPHWAGSWDPEPQLGRSVGFLVEWDTDQVESPKISTQSAPAPADSILFNGHRYKLIPGMVSWKEANEQATIMGGHLATLTTEREDLWVRKTFVDLLPKGHLLFMGGVKDAGIDTFRWSNGEPWSYEHLEKDSKSYRTADPLAVTYSNYPEGAGVWNAAWKPDDKWMVYEGKSRIEGFLVEWDTDQVESPKISTQSAPAPADSLLFNGHRYKYFPDVISWNAANQKATIMGGHLVTLTTEAEDLWVRKTFVLPLPVDKLLFIGGIKDAGIDSPYHWTNGEPWSYTHWTKGTPPKGLQESAMVFYVHDSPGTATWGGLWPPRYTILGNPNRIAGFVVEWDTDQVEAPKPPTPSVLAASPPPPDVEPIPLVSVDLLDGVDVKRDVVRGKWQKKPEGLIGARGILMLNQAAPDEYDLEAEFTATSGLPEVELILPLPTHLVAWRMGHGPVTEDPTVFDFGPSFNHDGLTVAERGKTSVMLPRLKVGQRYRCVIEVRKDSLRALLDGQEIASWKGDLERLSTKGWLEIDRIRNPRHPGLMVGAAEYLFHKAELRPKGAIVDKLAEFESQFKDAYERDVTRGAAGQALAALNAKYLAALDNTISDATKNGKPDDVTALRQEKQRIADKGPLPAADPVNIVVSLGKLRDIYRKAVAPLLKQREAAAEPVYVRYDEALAAYQAELAGKGEALSIQNLRDALEAKRHPAAAPELAAAAPSSKALLSAAPTQPAETLPKKPSKPKKLPTLPAEALQEPVPKPFTPEQAIAWALSLNGGAKIKRGAQEFEITTMGKMPQGTFTLTSLHIGAQQQLHVVSLAALSQLTDLQELILDDNLITDAGLAFLPKLPKLTHLSLNGCTITDAGLPLLSKQSALTSLALGNNSIDGSGLRELAGLQGITTLDLRNAHFFEDTLPTLATFTALTSLNLSSTPFTVTSLEPLAKLKNLKQLIIAGSATDQTVQSLESMTQLSALDLDRSAITDAALEHIGSMKGLRDLNFFSCNNLTDLGFAKLGPLKGLAKLNVTHTRLTDSQFIELSKKLSDLTELDLASDDITDQGLAGLLNLHKLTRLQVHARTCTDAGLAYLKRLVGLRNFGIAQRETLTPARFDAVKRALPNWRY